MEPNPILTDGQSTAQKRAPLTRPQLWLLLGALVIGVVFELMTELDYYYWYSIFWLVTLAVFITFNWGSVIHNKTALALILPTLVLCGVLMFDYIHYELLGFAMLAIPALLLTTGVFTTQGIAYRREGKAVLGVLKAAFVKPFTAVGTYFRAYVDVLGRKDRASSRHGWIGLAVGIPLMIVVLALLAGADAGMQRLLGGWIENINLWQWFWRAVVVLISSMLFYSLFYNLTWGKMDADQPPVQQNWKFAGPGVVIALLLAAYALFTYVQFTYLFGSTLPVDLTYSEYARDGFDQFLAVTLINFVLLGISLTKSEPGRVIKILQTLLIAASLMILASAAWRMLLYVGAYGLTIRRVMSLWLMVYFAFLAVVGAARVYREQTPFLRIGAFALVYWFTAFCCIDWSTLLHTFNMAHGFAG